MSTLNSLALFSILVVLIWAHIRTLNALRCMKNLQLNMQAYLQADIARIYREMARKERP